MLVRWNPGKKSANRDLSPFSSFGLLREGDLKGILMKNLIVLAFFLLLLSRDDPTFFFFKLNDAYLLQHPLSSAT